MKRILILLMIIGSCFNASGQYEHYYASVGNGAALGVTWDPATKSTPSLSLSGGNLTVSATSASGSILATIGKSSGKWYWEVVVNSYGAAVCTGIGQVGISGDMYVSAYGWCIANFVGSGYKGHNGGLAGYGSTVITTGSVIGVALDMDAGTVTFYVGNVSQGVAFTGLTGTVYPATGSQSGNSFNVTAHFSVTSFMYSPPAGFSALH